jgi:hypothetical protein
LLTNPDLGESGLYTIAPKTISYDTGIKNRRVIELLGGGLKNVLFDEGTNTVFLVKYLTYNPIRGGQDLRVKAIQTERATIKSALWEVFDRSYVFSNKDGYSLRGLEGPYKGISTSITTSTSTDTSKERGSKGGSKEEAVKYFFDKLGNIPIESLLVDFKEARPSGKLSPQRIKIITDELCAFSANVLIEAKKRWDTRRYAREGKNERYFYGICRGIRDEADHRRRNGLP